VESGYELARLLAHADRMLYCAKGDGRNRVAAFVQARHEARQVPADLQVVEAAVFAEAAPLAQTAQGRTSTPTLTLVDTHADRAGTSG
jgi:hypothetical protein